MYSFLPLRFQQKLGKTSAHELAGQLAGHDSVTDVGKKSTPAEK